MGAIDPGGDGLGIATEVANARASYLVLAGLVTAGLVPAGRSLDAQFRRRILGGR
jgi:hypothetical protein